VSSYSYNMIGAIACCDISGICTMLSEQIKGFYHGITKIFLLMLYLYHRLECFAAARGRVRIYQAKHECLWYKCYVPHCPCRLIARQYEVKTRIYSIDCLGKFDYGPAHATRNHRYTYICQQKRANPMESVESS